MARPKKVVREEDYIAETNIEETELPLTIEEQFQQAFKEEYELYKKAKKEEEEEKRKKLAMLTMPELIEKVRVNEVQKQLQTDAVGSMCLIFGDKNFGQFKECKILDDNKLEVTIGGKVKEIAIMHDPTQITINMRKYWTMGGIGWKIRYFFVWIVMRLTGMMTLGIIRFNCFFVRSDGEYTIDPSKDWTPWQLQRKVEKFLHLEGRLLKANIKSQLLSDQRGKDPFIKITYAFLIAIVVIVIANLWVIGGM